MNVAWTVDASGAIWYLAYLVIDGRPTADSSGPALDAYAFGWRAAQPSSQCKVGTIELWVLATEAEIGRLEKRISHFAPCTVEKASSSKISPSPARDNGRSTARSKRTVSQYGLAAIAVAFLSNLAIVVGFYRVLVANSLLLCTCRVQVLTRRSKEVRPAHSLTDMYKCSVSSRANRA